MTLINKTYFFTQKLFVAILIFAIIFSPYAFVGNFPNVSIEKQTALAATNVDANTGTFNGGSGFNANVDGVIQLASGKFLVWGDFTSYNGTTTNQIARINTDGSLDETFSAGTGPAGAGDEVDVIVEQSDGKLVVAGIFTSYNGNAVSGLVFRIDANGAFDSAFTTNVGTGFNNVVLDMDIQANDKIVAIGNFTSFNGTTRSRNLRLNADGTLDSMNITVSPNTNAVLQDVHIDANDKIVYMGSFTSCGISTTDGICRLTSAGSVDSASFNAMGTGPNLSGTLSWVAEQADGKYLIGGSVIDYDGNTQPNTGGDFHIFRINSDGSWDTTFVTPTDSPNNLNQQTAAVQPDGKILLGGLAQGTYDGQNRFGIMRINSDGSLDTDYDPGNAMFGGVISGGGASAVKDIIVIDNDNHIPFGSFASYNGVTVNGIVGLVGPSSGPLVEFSFATTSTSENATSTSPVIIYGGGILNTAGDVTITVTSGTATTTDHSFASSTAITIPAGDYSTSTATISLAGSIIDDALVETDETIIFTVTSATSTITVGDADGDSTNESIFTYTILNDDNYLVSIAGTQNGSENNSGTTTNLAFEVSVTPTNESGSAITGTISYSGTGTSTDYTIASTTFSVANNSSTTTVLVSVTEDILIEGAETVVLTLSALSDGVLGNTVATGTIVDDDTGEITVSTTSIIMNEAATTTFTVQLDRAPLSNVVVSLVSNDTAEVTLSTSSITFSSSTWNIAQSVEILAVADTNFATGTATITVAVIDASSDDGFDPATDKTVNISVVDDDDTDGDGNADSTEDAGFNGGDGNGDGTPDKQQQHVSGAPNPVTGAYTTLEAVGACTFIIENAFVAESSLSVSDATADYPVGLVDFKVQCVTNGASTTINLYYDQEYNTSDWTYKKYDSGGNVYADITSIVTFSTTTVGTSTVTKASFVVTDGDPQTDEDGLANGVINDPSGPAIVVTTTTSSGGSGSGTRYSCRDEKATNYEQYGKHDQNKCEYKSEEEEEEETNEVTATDSVCSPYLTESIRLGASNSSGEVNKLITFLNDKQGENLELDGVYNQDDYQAVKRFQAKYGMEVLNIWGISQSTGYVYLTTRNKINSFYCDKNITCPYFNEHNGINKNNQSNEVLKTKILMQELGFYQGELNDKWGSDMQKSVARFQEKFHATMLDPWNIKYGTGYKYKTTNRFLNSLVGCKLPPEKLENGVTISY